MQQYFILDNNFYLAEEKIFSTDNRAFRYGDAIFESMHANGRRVQFFEAHFQRLLHGLAQLKMLPPFSFCKEQIHNRIEKLLHRNRLFNGARVRLTVFRVSEGLYCPQRDDVSILIEAEKLENSTYVLNEEGYKIDIFNEIHKEINCFSSVKSANALLFVMAGIYKRQNKLDDCIILNRNGNIIESIGSNLFFIENNNIYTPATTEGCLPGIMRQQIIKIARSCGYCVEEITNLRPLQLLEAEEVFLTNAVCGIRWVLAFNNKRFFCKTSKSLVNELNSIAF